MGKLNLFIFIICVQSLYITLSVCVYDAELLQDEEIERETVPGSIFEVTEKTFFNKSLNNFKKETRRKRDSVNNTVINTTSTTAVNTTTAVLHTAVNINGSDISVISNIESNKKNNESKGATLELTKKSTSQQCSYFIYNSGFDIDKMPALWRAVYYKLPGKLGCFQLLIRKISVEEREEYRRTYGDFNKTINWDECHMEIKSSAVTDRNHYLQGGAGDFGIMRNMIISPVDDVLLVAENYTLQEDSPDQWLMVKDLLLLHGCEADDMVAFAKATKHVSKEDVAEVLRELGEDLTGHMLCEDPME